MVHPSFFMHDTMINGTKNHKQLLGLILSNNCPWTEHINKAYTRHNLMRTLKYKVSKNLWKMYILHMFALCLNTATLYVIIVPRNKKQLESIHQETARVITGATKNSK